MLLLLLVFSERPGSYVLIAHRPSLAPCRVSFRAQDDEGLRVFHGDHFKFPLYRDENLDFYRAFGDGKITDHLSWWSLLNPYKIYKGMKGMNKRMKSKGLEGNLVGEGLKTGGIIVFGSDGEPRYAYPEVTGSALEVDDLVAAVRDVRENGGDGEL